jgi:hypothetical protein
MLPRALTRSWDRVYCCPTAAKSLVFALRVLGFSTVFAGKKESRRADSNRFPAHYE